MHYFCLNLKYKGPFIVLYQIFFHKTPNLKNLGIITLFQSNLSHRFFYLLSHKMSYISFMITLIQKKMVNFIIDIHDIFIIDSFWKTLIWVDLKKVVQFHQRSQSLFHNMNLNYDYSHIYHICTGPRQQFTQG